ncbi:dienelactone hydrolase family protein [Rhodococcus antarcticus]|uniref:Dienelactone hydrolase family protein n=1 Tax=Rhodococcus antarcticus TaxID=2987751 RepID=A0ABY6P1K2_9NOCA|nr:dienelactone hydrolase family protein [Rhodococcus antarcticus]UZJ25369.1 dienelactone hydrolase family protein [Rhodococcus antarcticus]
MASRRGKSGNLKSVVAELSRRGPHRVLRGDLALAGLPGVLMTPERGLGLPAVAFGHAWLQPVHRYLGTLAHLASWGIVVAAPATERGPLPSHAGLAADLATALDVCSKVRLGPGEISVDPDRLGVAGHSMGAGAAVLLAAQDPRVKAFAGFATAETSPSAVHAAARVTVPGLFLDAEDDSVTPAASNAEKIAAAWKGPVSVRTVTGASDIGLLEGRHLGDLFLDGGSEKKTQRVVRALVTGFLLGQLADDERFAELASATAEIKRTTVVDLSAA